MSKSLQVIVCLKREALPVLGHRLVSGTTSSAAAEGFLQEILDSVPVPLEQL